VPFSSGSGWKTCVFWAEVAEKHAFFRWKWLKMANQHQWGTPLMAILLL
jgi:hypothetical protein